jgi:HEAT repeat protein
MANEITPETAADVAGKSPAHPGDPILGAVEGAFDRAGPPGPSRGGPATPRPAPAPPPATRTAPPVGSAGPRALLSADPGERRRALTRLLEAGVGPGETGAVARLLVTDPDPDLRWMAARALAEAAALPPGDLVARALTDPNDRVRAAVVGVAARMGPFAVSALIPLATRRGWPLTQHAALGALPEVISPRGPRPRELEALLREVGTMEPPPLRSERPGLEAIARAVGTERLVPHLEGRDPQRLGAARLLFFEGSPASLRPLAALVDDPAEGVRQVAAGAAHLLGSYRAEPGGDGSGESQTALSSAEPSGGTGEDPLTSLASALGDPDPNVRAQAVSALRGIDRGTLEVWALRALGDGSADLAGTAAALVEQIGLAGVASQVLERAASLGPDGQGPYLRALSALRLDPGELAGLVSSIDPTQRQSAIRLLWQTAGRAILPFLPPFLKDTAGPVRMAVLEVVAESGDQSANAIARRLLETDSSAAVRATAVHVLARADAATRSEILAQALSDPDPDVRTTALEALPRASATDMVGLLLRALQDEDDRVWRAAVAHLAGLPARELPVLWSALRQSPKVKREELISALERSEPDRLATLAAQNANSPRPVERALATEMAARAGSPECAALVAAALSDPDPRVRRTAAVAMSNVRTPAAVGSLSRTLSDPHAEVRVEAVRALGMIDDDSVPAILIAALQDPEVRVRDTASEALSRWHSPAVARRLASALGSPDLRRPAGDVLERMGHAAVKPLVEVVMGDDTEAAAAAGALLQRIAGAQSFLPDLSSIDPEERLRAVEVLGVIGGDVASEALLGTLSDPDPLIRVRSAALLGALGDLRAIRALRRVFLSDPVGEVAAAAEEALRSLGATGGSEDLQILHDVPEDLPGPSKD